MAASVFLHTEWSEKPPKYATLRTTEFCIYVDRTSEVIIGKIRRTVKKKLPKLDREDVLTCYLEQELHLTGSRKQLAKAERLIVEILNKEREAFHLVG